MSYYILPSIGLDFIEDEQGDKRPILRDTKTGGVIHPEEGIRIIHQLMDTYFSISRELIDADDTEWAFRKAGDYEFSAEYMKSDPARIGAGHYRRLANGDVYVMQSGDLYKIGVSTSTKNRLKQVAATTKDPVKVVHSREVKNPYTLESWLHNRFAHCHVHGEWFRLMEFDLDHVTTLIDRWTGEEVDA